jgi:hypothetical protein
MTKFVSCSFGLIQILLTFIPENFNNEGLWGAVISQSDVMGNLKQQTRKQ